MLEDYARQHAPTSDRDLPVVVALLPATSRQRAVAVGVVVSGRSVLMVLYCCFGLVNTRHVVPMVTDFFGTAIEVKRQ